MSHVSRDRNGIGEQVQITLRKTAAAARPPLSAGDWNSVQNVDTLRAAGTGAGPAPEIMSSRLIAFSGQDLQTRIFRPGSRILCGARVWGDSHPERTIGVEDWSIGYGQVTTGLNLAHCRLGLKKDN